MLAPTRDAHGIFTGARVSEPLELGPAVGYGVLQGVTEFLPVSSDGHLAAFALMFGGAPMSLPLAVLLHAGTLLATVAVFRADLGRLVQGALRGLGDPGTFLRSDDGALLSTVAVASLPTAAIGLALEALTAEANRHPEVVGAGFLLSAVAAASTRRRSSATIERLSLRGALVLGTVQGLAVLPGLSRSGSTIACALLLGLSPLAAFRLSFLLSIPAVTGAILLELGAPGMLASLGATAWIGAAVACVSGYFALELLRRILALGHFWRFAWYLIVVGTAMIALGTFGAGNG